MQLNLWFWNRIFFLTNPCFTLFTLLVISQCVTINRWTSISLISLFCLHVSWQFVCFANSCLLTISYECAWIWYEFACHLIVFLKSSDTCLTSLFLVLVATMYTSKCVDKCFATTAWIEPLKETATIPGTNNLEPAGCACLKKTIRSSTGTFFDRNGWVENHEKMLVDWVNFFHILVWHWIIVDMWIRQRLWWIWYETFILFRWRHLLIM